MPEMRDWANLLPELLREIAGRLAELPDLFRFWCVCHRWHSAAKSITNLTPHLPWICIDNSLSFLSLSSTRRYTIPTDINRVYMSKIRPMMAGGLFVLDKHTQLTMLLNPITRSSLQLPRGNLYLSRTDKIKLFGSLIVVFGDNESPWPSCISLRDIGEEFSKSIQIAPHALQETRLCDFACWKEKLFFISSSAQATWVYDMQTRQKVSEIPLSILFKRGYLVESLHGDLMLVLRIERSVFVVLRLDETGDELKWKEISSIGNTVILMDEVETSCFAASDFKGLRPNCIYFLDSYGVKTFDLNKNECDKTPLFMGASLISWELARWFIPSLRSRTLGSTQVRL